jgi:hypothetical protein
MALVGHDGGDNNDQFCRTLCVTDVATGWTRARSGRSKGERVVAAALQQIQLELLFALEGIHSDNGSEFISHIHQPSPGALGRCHANHLHPWSAPPQQRQRSCRAKERLDCAPRGGYFRYGSPVSSSCSTGSGWPKHSY